MKVKDLASDRLSGLNGLTGRVARETVALLSAAGRVEIQTDSGRCLRLKISKIEAEYQRPRASSKTMLKPRWVSSEHVGLHQQGVDFEVCGSWEKFFCCLCA